MSSTQKNKINSLITVIGIIFLSIVIALISYDILFGTYSINSNKKISNVVVSKEKELTKINIENTGYRLITNSGEDGGQEVPHFHIHILAGEKIGKLR